MANGSSNDSSTSRGVKELSHSKGALYQSNSIGGSIVIQTPMQCNDIVFTRDAPVCQQDIHFYQNKMATVMISVAIFSGNGLRLTQSSPPFLPPPPAVSPS